MAFKMIVTDLDRTLLRSDITISAYTKEVLLRCREKGIKIAFATARYFRTIDEWIVPAIGFCPDIVISSNGAFAYGLDTVYYQALIKPELANRIITEIRARGGQVTTGTARMRLSERPIEKTHAPFSFPCSFKNAITDDVHYIDYRGGSNIENEIIHLFPQIRLQSYIDSLRTFVHKNARKGLALQKVMEQMNIAEAKTAGFGDDVNDLDFLRVCGTKIAVENAVDNVKVLADDVCGSNDEDGVAKWLEKNVL